MSHKFILSSSLIRHLAHLGVAPNSPSHLLEALQKGVLQLSSTSSSYHLPLYQRYTGFAFSKIKELLRAFGFYVTITGNESHCAQFSAFDEPLYINHIFILELS